MNERVIILTTPTSGTSSLWRIAERYLPADYPRGWFINDCLDRGIAFDDIRNQVLPKKGCYIFNQPHLFNFNQDLSGTKFILNFRDPRDMSCNQYHWLFSHPYPHLTEKEIEEERAAARMAGIDKYVISLDHRPLFSAHEEFLRRADLMENAITVSYVRLCFETDGVVEQMADFFGSQDLALIEDAKTFEHPSSLVQSQEWIGGRWSGADVFPGRARVELKSETFLVLTERYKNILQALHSLDAPRYSYFYS